jgi:hypothetical protein
MDKKEMRAAINQLVEAWHDQGDAQEQLEIFAATHAPPKPPDQFEGLPDLLDFYAARRRYEDELADHKSALAVAKDTYAEAARQLQDVLPENVPLYYTYQGGRRAASEGTEYRIVHRQGEVIIQGFREATQP